jgi:DNA-binding transcriptional regulator YdaS (Cro superfamily)
MFGINSIRKVVTSLGDSLAKFNQTIHGSADAAAKTTECVKSGASGLMTAKGVKDCVVTYQCKDMVCFTISVVGTTADVSNHICGNIPGLKKVTPLTTYISLGCKYFVHLCQTGNITFSCKDPI